MSSRLLLAGLGILLLGLPSHATSSVFSGGEIVPGVSIGRLRLGGDVDAETRQFGKPSGGDAAMGHFVTVWSSGKGDTLTVASERSPSELKARVRQVRVTSPYFKTRKGIGSGSTLSMVEAAFPHARAVMHKLKSAYVGKIALLDDAAQGIAFEFPVNDGTLAANAHCAAIMIHPKGYSTEALYSPVYTVGDNHEIKLYTVAAIPSL